MTALRLLMLAILLWPARASAWCLQAKGPMFKMYWAFYFKDHRIKVFISLGKNSSFLHTGLSLPQAEALVRRVVAVHNETVGPPYLVYAGTTDKDLGEMNSLRPRDPGIVIDSFSCAQPAPFPCDPNVHACANIAWQLTPQLASKGRVTFQPRSEDCPPFGSQTWDLDPNLGPDAAGIMLHEIGHVLGLGHTNLSPEECDGPSDGAGGSGVMLAPPGSFFPATRDWRRDDLEGLREIWGEAIEHSVYTWQDSAFPANPLEDAGVALCAGVRTPPTLTSAVTGIGAVETQYVAFTDENDRVVHLEWNGAAFKPPAVGAVIDQGELGVSFASPAIAHSDQGRGAARVFAIWSASESKTSAGVRLRWALRDPDGGSWTYGFLETPDGEKQRSNDVAVGFDATTSQFVVTSITDATHPYFVAVDLQGNQSEPLVLGSGFTGAPFVFDIGRANCFAHERVSRCVVPYISSEFDQFDPGAEALRAGWYHIELQPDGTMTLIHAPLVSDFQPRGMVDLSSGSEGFRGVVGDRRYEIARTLDEDAAEVPALDFGPFSADDWPVRIGSQTSPTGEVYRFAARRLGQLCGNGRLECDETCDDGNSLDSDGCSASCRVELSPTTGDAPTTGDVTEGATTTGPETEGLTTAGPATAADTGPIGDDSGCGCRAQGHANPLILVLLGLRRRRSRGAAPRPPRSGRVVVVNRDCCPSASAGSRLRGVPADSGSRRRSSPP